MYFPLSRATLDLNPFLFWCYEVGAVEIAACDAINHLVSFPRIIAISAAVNHSFPCLGGIAVSALQSCLHNPRPSITNQPHIPWAVQRRPEQRVQPLPVPLPLLCTLQAISYRTFSSIKASGTMQGTHNLIIGNNWRLNGAVGNSQTSSVELPAQQHLCSASNLSDFQQNLFWWVFFLL